MFWTLNNLSLPGELKFLEEIKSYFTQRKKLEEDYAENIRRLDTQFVKQCNNLTNNYCTKTWLKLLDQSTKAADCMSAGVDTFEKVCLCNFINCQSSLSDCEVMLLLTLLAMISGVSRQVYKVNLRYIDHLLL